MKGGIWLSVCWLCFAMSSTLSGPTAVLQAQNADLAVTNDSRYLGGQRWGWTIFISAPQEVLDRIRCVDYTLPASFRDPKRRVCQTEDSATPFGLKETAWGVLQVGVLVTYKSGETRGLLHTIELESRASEQPLDIAAKHSSSGAAPSLRKWSVWIESPREVLDQVHLVQYRLPLVFMQSTAEEIQEVFDRGAGNRGFKLSGVGWTGFTIEIRVFFKDGTYQDLRHWITF